MATNSKIEWCDHTFNAWLGCEKVSPACAHCYAESWAKRSGLVKWGAGQPRRRTTDAYWKQPLKWEREAELTVGEGGVFGDVRRPRVFCNSLADWLDDQVPGVWLYDLLDLIRMTPNLDWLLLTKRPENWQRLLSTSMSGHSSDRADEWIESWLDGTPPPNVWVGTTVEDQQRADERIPSLLSIPARVRFLSCEPLLGPLNLQQIPVHDESSTLLFPLAGEVTFEGRNEPMPLRMGGIHWIIAGGESGPSARPMHPGWIDSIRDQAQQSYVPFLFKQWGEWLPRTGGVMAHEDLLDPKQPKIRLSWDGKNSQTEACDPSSDVWMGKVGKAKAGRLLEGREWNEFPTHA